MGTYGLGWVLNGQGKT